MRKNVYYIEDSTSHFSNFYDSFKDDINVFPTYDTWKDEMEIIRLYLQSQTEENEYNLVKCFEKYDIDVFIIDIKLFHDYNGGGMIYHEVLMNHSAWKEKKYIFLTLAEKSPEIPISQNVRFCPKIVNQTSKTEDIDFAKTFSNVRLALKELNGSGSNILKDLIRDLFKN